MPLLDYRCRCFIRIFNWYFSLFFFFSPVAFLFLVHLFICVRRLVRVKKMFLKKFFKWHSMVHARCFMHICALVCVFACKWPNKCFAFVNKFDLKTQHKPNLRIHKIMKIRGNNVKDDRVKRERREKKKEWKLIKSAKNVFNFAAMQTFQELTTKVHTAQWQNNNDRRAASCISPLNWMWEWDGER